LLGEEFGHLDEGRRQVNTLDMTPVELSQLPRRTAKAGAGVQNLPAGLNPSELGELGGRFGATDVEVVERRQMLRRDPTRAQRFEQSPHAAGDV
jgi:hypothetical protein